MINEKWIIENKGYKAWQYNWKKKKYVEVDEWYYSTMGNIDIILSKNYPFTDDEWIRWGLHEKGKPPTWILPRPQKKIVEEGRTIYTVFTDNDINRLMYEMNEEDFFDLMHQKFAQ